MSGNVSVRTVTQAALTVSDHDEADDSHSSSAALEKASKEQKFHRLLQIIKKINMLFILVFVCYLSWTIPAHYGLYSGHSGSRKPSGNHTLFLQVNESDSTEKRMQFFNPSDERQKNATYQTDIILPSHRKASKRLRKKERNRKRHRNRKGGKFYANLDDHLNLTDSSYQGKNSKNSCKDCKIRKRKGRNRQYDSGMNISVLRRIMEQVADDTMSGARSGDGTLSSFLDFDSKTNSNGNGKSQVNKDGSQNKKTWGSGQNWLNLATQTGYRIDGNIVVKDEYTQWSEWSPCSTSCGAGERERIRTCGSACKEVESMVCISPSCEGMDEKINAKTITEFYQWETDGFVPPLSKPEPEFLDPGTDACDQWLKCNKDIAQKFIEKSSLPACPCTFPLVRVKSRAIWDAKSTKDILWLDVSAHNVLVYKPGAIYCIRQKLFPGAKTLAVQQCCYDSSHLLLTRGKAAGTPNLVSPYISKELHYKVDLLPWILCKGDWTRYNKVLPPNNDLMCEENPSEDELERQRTEVKNY